MTALAGAQGRTGRVPIEELEFEMDVRGVAVERLIQT
jgi:hypothetical protein